MQNEPDNPHVYLSFCNKALLILEKKGFWNVAWALEQVSYFDTLFSVIIYESRRWFSLFD